MIVFCSFIAYCLSSLTKLSAVQESSEEVGSSSIMTAGFERSSQAIEQRFFSPPDRPRRIESPMMVFWQDLRSSASMTWSTWRILCSCDIESGRRSMAA